MAFDVSKITTAVNNYLYSISDTNKMLTESVSSGSTDLSGIFQKYLTGALNNIDASNLSTDDRQAIIDAMKVSDSMNLYGLNGNSDSDSSQDMLSTLSSLTSLGAGNDTASTDVVKSVDKSSDSDLSQAFAQASDMSSNTALHLEDEIKGVFAGMDNLGEVILNKIASRDSTGEINRSVANLDIQSDIQRSIASHDRSDEISEYNSYNASRIASYKNAGGSTSVFGDFKL
ncbi:MAG: hypothetical protein IJI01_05785 [Butyrivibrio sp.]|uniref:hypothetical protein n=1 Tax=Butyrivibrio sp. TaxID=28121 RepID=UPI0025C42AE1|nr:hypothetical protein [Butyrivibrio sp.]MBQ6588170.1 hypothetical protein [Butyrivibrio sp.]